MAVATVVPVPLNSLIVSPGSDITTLAGFAGKKIGVTGIPSDDAFYQTMLKTAGLTASDVTKVNVGFNLVPSVLSNKVDGIIGGYRNVEAIQIEQTSGTKPVVFPADRARRSELRGARLVANSDRLASDAAYADAVKRFVAALVKGTDAAIADPTGATAIMKTATQYDPKFLDESVPYTLTLLEARRRHQDRMHRRRPRGRATGTGCRATGSSRARPMRRRSRRTNTCPYSLPSSGRVAKPDARAGGHRPTRQRYEPRSSGENVDGSPYGQR